MILLSAAKINQHPTTEGLIKFISQIPEVLATVSRRKSRSSSAYHGGLHPDKPNIRWKHHRLKMHFIHLTYKISQLSHTYLNCARNAQNLQLGKIIKHKACLIVKCCVSHVIYWIPSWKWKMGWLYGQKRYLLITDPGDHGAAQGVTAAT